MIRTIFSGSGFLAVLMASLLFSTPAFAKKYDDDNGKQKYSKKDKHKKNDHGEDNGSDIHVDVHFGDQERVIIREYYEDRGNKGRCPPGLA